MCRVIFCIILNIAAFSVLPINYSFVPFLGMVFSSLLLIITSDFLHIDVNYWIRFEELGYMSMASLYVIALIVFVLKGLQPIVLIYHSFATMAYGYESIVNQKLTRLKSSSSAVV